MKLMPYFKTNKEWYYLNPKRDQKGEKAFLLTDKAPPEAVESYNEWYKKPEIWEDEYGVWEPEEF